MKRSIAFLFVIGIVSSSQAQTSKGDWMVGGYFKINTADNNTQIGLTPTAGAFVVNNLAIGGNLLFDYQKAGDNKVTTFGIGPFVRYYFTEANVKPLFHGSLSFLSQKFKSGSFASSTTSGINYFLGGGAAIFISEHASIDILMGYDHTRFDGDGSGGFALNVGFQVYLHKGQVDRVRGSKN